MTFIKRFLIIIHFLIVIVTVSHLYEIINWKPLSDSMDIYSSITYTNRNFGFFAPTVNEDFQVTFDMFKENDTIGYKFFLNEANVETKIRFSTMLWHFAEWNEDSQMDLYGRSWGVFCMNNDTAINKVIITVFKNYLPSMSEYRSGKRINSLLYYQTTLDAN